MKNICIFIFLLVFLVLFAGTAWCNDLDDGMSSYTDDSISKWDNLGKKDRNINFIKMNAKSRALVRQKNGGKNGTSTGSGDANMNSVVMGAGSNVKGDIIIIDESKGDKTLIAD